MVTKKVAIKEHCKISKSNCKIKLEEEKVQFYILNPNKKELYEIKVDWCVFEKNRAPERCDYLIIDKINGTEYFIELKWSDFEKGCSQLSSSDNLLSNKKPNFCSLVIWKRIVKIARIQSKIALFKSQNSRFQLFYSWDSQTII